MPRRPTGPHLALRERSGRPAVYVIRDSGKVELSTGTADRREAEGRLADYIRSKPARDAAAVAGPLPPDLMTVRAVLDLYDLEHVPTVAAPERLSYAILALLPFWGDVPVAGITKATCRAYAKKRVRRLRDGTVQPIQPGTIRRELNVLQAAINFAVEAGALTTGRSVELPEKPAPKQRALTRDEVARLLRVCRRRDLPHLARFILVSLYTGTRKAAVLDLRLGVARTDGGWVDLGRGIMHRRGREERETAKRRPAVRLPRQILAHMRRWHGAGAQWAVEWRGGRVADVQTGFEAVAREAGLGWRPTPHTLKHTAISWAIQGGASVEDAATFFGTSPQTIINTYWDQSPHFQAGAVSAVERMGRRR